MGDRRLFFGALVLIAGAGTQKAHAAPAPPSRPPWRVATRAAGTAAAVERLSDLLLGEGWGCVTFRSESGTVDQCWDAGPQPRARIVPWLEHKHMVGPDRVCEYDMGKLTFRCWHRPRRGDKGPRPMPRPWAWMNPHGAIREDDQNRSDRLTDVVLGGTFACLQTSKDDRVFCLGDDRFGQLGSTSPPTPESKADGPAFLHGLGEGMPALGTWHGCGLGDASPFGQRVPVLCWGRGDYGQLGAKPPDKCTVDGRAVPCARRPIPGSGVYDPMSILGAGDLFTCILTPEGLSCWGASRDGLFGAPGSCPERLRRAWPTLAGPVAAPNASCTSTAVAVPGVPGVTELGSYLKVTPRQICYRSGETERCLSGVPKPRDASIQDYQASPGSDASACAMRGDGVVCWGEAYSPPGELDRPVSITFEPMPPLGEMAIVSDTDTTRWKKYCQIRQVCPEPVRKLPPCEAREGARAVGEVLEAVSSLAGQIVRVRGALAVGEFTPTAPVFYGGSCNPAVRCCVGVWAPIVVGDVDHALPIDGMRCTGDHSRACCNAPAYGQTVVVTGRLERVRNQDGAGKVSWRLGEATACEAPPADR